MLGFLHVIAIEAGIRVPGYLSTSQDLKFSDVPAGCFASLEAVPTAGWLQIMVLTCMQEAGTGFASKPQTDDAEPGDIALDSWVRYDDPEVRTFKLNVERQNGRAAMLGITGCLIHELLGVDVLRGRHRRLAAARCVRSPWLDRDARHAPVRDYGDQAWPRCDARIPPRDRDRSRRPSPGLPLRLAGLEVLRRAGGLLRVARGRPDRGLAPDHGPYVHAGGRHGLRVQAADRRCRARRHRARLVGPLR